MKNIPQGQDSAARGVNTCDSIREPNQGFEGCPMTSQSGILQRALQAYDDNKELRNLAGAAARVEATGYVKWTRVEDTMEFAVAMGYRKLGIAACVGPKREATFIGIGP